MTFTFTQGVLLAVVVAMALVWNLGRHNIPKSFRRVFFFLLVVAIGFLVEPFFRTFAGDEHTETAAITAVDLPVDEARHAAFDLHRAQKWPQAIAAYDTFLKRNGEDVEVLYWRAMAHWKNAQFDEAYRDFRRVIDLDPTNLEAYRNADRLLARQKKWDETITLWNWYISRQPPNATAHHERGGAYFHKGDMAAARADVRRACELGMNLGCRMAERLKGQ